VVPRADLTAVIEQTQAQEQTERRMREAINAAGTSIR
jgi:regulator of RNase E activity RraA